MAKSRVIWLVWDAAAHWLVRDLLTEGAMPALATVVRDGTLRPTKVSGPNAQTPPSLATLFTGAGAEEHGITGFTLPDPQNGVSATRSGFDRKALLVPPIWERLGPDFKTCLVHMPWVDASGQLPAGCVYAIEGFSRRQARGGAAPIEESCTEVRIGDHAVQVRVCGANFELERRGAELLSLRLNSPSWQPWPAVDSKQVLVRAVSRSHDGTPVLLFTGSWEAVAGPGVNDQNAVRRLGPFVGEGLGRAYRSSALGQRLSEGGTGAAEELFMETVELAAAYFGRCCLSAVVGLPDTALTIAYQPCLDDVEHELVGLCDPFSRAYDPAVAPRAYELIRRAYTWVDEQLGEVLGAIDDDTAVVVSSDHGMGGTGYVAHLNEVLAAAGLLRFDSHGRINAAETAIACSPACDGSLWVNGEGLPHGWVPQHRRGEYIARAARALEAAREPSTGIPVVAQLQQSSGAQHTPDLLVTLRPDFHLDAGPAPSSNPIVTSPKSGGHLHHGDDERFHGIFAARGLGLGPHDAAEVVQSREVAHIVAARLGAQELNACL